MHISDLNLIQFRNYDDIYLKPSNSLNIIIGMNAQGKTTILEAVYMIATARSWRTGKDQELINWDKNEARVFASVVRESSNNVDIEISLQRNQKKSVKVNTIRQSKLADLMGQVNAVLIEPYDVEIVRSDPSKRRRFMDIEISQMQPQYCNLAAGYKRVLEHRNKLLKDINSEKMSISMLEVWTDQLVIYASQIIERRLKFIKNISEKAKLIHANITDNLEKLDIMYSSPIDIEPSMTADEIAERMRIYLHKRRFDEVNRGITLAGPQRDDLIFTLNGIDTRIYGSQGQQRTIALSLRLAEIDIMEESAEEPPIVLLDDIMTDLDESRRMNVFEMTKGRCQTFITAANSRLLDDEFIADGMVFVAANGEVKNNEIR